MRKLEHTPGPWKVAGKIYVDGPNFINLARASENPTGNLKQDCDGHKIAIANARLIASAPELLDALEEIISYHYKMMAGYPGDVHADILTKKLLKISETAIAKARGES